MKKIYAFALFLISLSVHAQQDVQFTQYMFNKIYYNPGVAGTGGAICLNALHRSQWVGFEGAPTTQNINANIPFQSLHGGLSARIVNDQIGFFQNIDFGVGYAYQLELDRGTLGFGISLNLRNNALSGANWVPTDGNLTSDNSIPAASSSGMSFDPGFGVFYNSENIWGGISTISLLESSASLQSVTGGSLAFRNARHYYVMGGYNWQIPATNWMLMPSTLIKLDARSSPTLDVNVMGMYNNKLWGGVTYRVQDAVAVNLGYQILPSLKFGYSYDIATGALSSQTSGGSHEIMLKYCFKIEIPPRQKGSYRNPRFL